MALLSCASLGFFLSDFLFFSPSSFLPSFPPSLACSQPLLLLPRTHLLLCRAFPMFLAIETRLQCYNLQAFLLKSKVCTWCSVLLARPLDVLLHIHELEDPVPENLCCTLPLFHILCYGKPFRFIPSQPPLSLERSGPVKERTCNYALGLRYCAWATTHDIAGFSSGALKASSQCLPMSPLSHPQAHNATVMHDTADLIHCHCLKQETVVSFHRCPPLKLILSFGATFDVSECFVALCAVRLPCRKLCGQAPSFAQVTMPLAILDTFALPLCGCTQVLAPGWGWLLLCCSLCSG